MSLGEFFEDLSKGNFSHAFKRFEDFFGGLPPWLKNFLIALKSDEGKILMAAAEEYAKKIAAGDLSTATFVQAVKDIEKELATEGVKLLRQDIFAALNAAVADLLKDKPTQA